MNQLLRKGSFIVVTILFFLAGIQGCKDDYESTVPYVPVDFNLNPTNLIELNIAGGSVYLKNLGHGGIIVFRDLTDDPNPFLAYDATCTYDLSPSCKVVVEEGSGLATCPCCGSQFVLFSASGSVTKGPATEPLKQYHTSFSGGLINIRN
jgi:Rieske Fe-S protein